MSAESSGTAHQVEDDDVQEEHSEHSEGESLDCLHCDDGDDQTLVTASATGILIVCLNTCKVRVQALFELQDGIMFLCIAAVSMCM